VFFFPSKNDSKTHNTQLTCTPTIAQNSYTNPITTQLYIFISFFLIHGIFVAQYFKPTVIAGFRVLQFKTTTGLDERHSFVKSTKCEMKLTAVDVLKVGDEVRRLFQAAFAKKDLCPP